MATLKIKWIKLNTEFNFDEFLTLIESTPYEKKVGEGFTRVRREAHKVSAIFNKKIINEVVIDDPLGDRINFEIIEFFKIEFSVVFNQNNEGLISIYNPPKKTKYLIDYFYSKFRLKIFFDSIKFNLVDFLSYLEKDCSYEVLSIRKVKVSNLLIGDNSKANIEVISSKNALKDIANYVFGDGYEIDKIKGLAISEKGNFIFEINKNGSASVAEDEVDKFNNVVFKYM